MYKWLTAALISALPVPALAALPIGATAPAIKTQGALAGKPFVFSLADALKKGPVVLYFYPAAFTKGCTIEAHEFAEATDEFKKMGATVIGMSADNIDTLKRFSREACRDKFAVAAASPETIRAYDAVFAKRPALADRTSYVIAPTGKILYVHSDLNPQNHVRNTLAAVRAWKVKAGGR